eukprot:13720847-Alexandrium_andersonii.AAC.1
MDTWDRARSAWGIKVTPATPARGQLLPHLMYDKRPHGAKGRIVMRDVEAFGLLENHRLEPSATLSGIGDVELLRNADFPICFALWRRRQGQGVRH